MTRAAVTLRAMRAALVRRLPRSAAENRGAWALVLAILAVLVALGLWANNSQVDELVRARGQVIAAARTQIVQATDNVVLRDLLVREGQTVRRNQLLARFDDNRARAAYDDSRNKVAALKAALARLNAEVYGGPIAFADDLAEWSVFRQNQTELYTRRRRVLDEGIAALRANRDLVAQELAITEPLLASGDVGKVEVIRLRRAIAELDGQMATLRNRFFQDAQVEMTKAEEDLATQEELLREREAILSFTELRAPVAGLVNRINVMTPGASIRQGETVVEMLPTSSELIVEAKYLPSDVASLRLGLPATIKLDAYDPAIYGSLEGRVSYISPDSLSDTGPQGQAMIYYRVHIKLDPRRRGLRPLPVTAGMTVTAEVRSKKRTILSYLTKPITKTLSNSLNER